MAMKPLAPYREEHERLTRILARYPTITELAAAVGRTSCPTWQAVHAMNLPVSRGYYNPRTGQTETRAYVPEKYVHRYIRENDGRRPAKVRPVVFNFSHRFLTVSASSPSNAPNMAWRDSKCRLEKSQQQLVDGE